MKRIVLLSVLLTVLMTVPIVDGLGEMSLPKAPKRDVKQTEFVALWLKEIQTIKVGMTRKQLLEAFTTEGGLSSRTWRTYVYRRCPYIKVDVEFKSVGNERDQLGQRPEDVIAKISRPYLQWPIMD
ncbi:MAG: hypothetical protein Q8Q12_17670 [bacterium]|nr:hypothetical protein [bacterium]